MKLFALRPKIRGPVIRESLAISPEKAVEAYEHFRARYNKGCVPDSLNLDNYEIVEVEINVLRIVPWEDV